MLGRKISDGLEMPREALDDTPLMTVCGNGEIIVENFKRILSFSENRVVVAVKKGCCNIGGENLKLEYIKRDIVKVRGRIYQISLSEGL
ncbi:MAG: YabP/YqfC family sporulation protein [Clostridiales bacterium]|nr:YabP/YqfC family sporulation protein [Clostridiales bacterium]